MEEGWQEETAILCALGGWALPCVCCPLWLLGRSWRWVPLGTKNDMLCSTNLSSYMDDVLDSNKGRKWFGTFGRWGNVYFHHFDDSCCHTIGVVAWSEPVLSPSEDLVLCFYWVTLTLHLFSSRRVSLSLKYSVLLLVEKDSTSLDKAAVHSESIVIVVDYNYEAW